MFKIGLNRAIQEDDIYEVTNHMRCDQNTEAYAKLWKLELEKDKPNMVRVMLNVHGYRALLTGFFYTIIESLAR